MGFNFFKIKKRSDTLDEKVNYPLELFEKYIGQELYILYSNEGEIRRRTETLKRVSEFGLEFHTKTGGHYILHWNFKNPITKENNQIFEVYSGKDLLYDSIKINE